MEFISVEATVNRVIPVKDYIRGFGTPDKVIDVMKRSMMCAKIQGFISKCDVQLIDDKAVITIKACIDKEIPDYMDMEAWKIWDIASYPSQLNDFHRVIDLKVYEH